jgi:hypothetical protein
MPGQPPAQPDQPKAEKNKKKADKSRGPNSFKLLRFRLLGLTSLASFTLGFLSFLLGLVLFSLLRFLRVRAEERNEQP